MGFSDAILSGFHHYADFRGRAPSAFWWRWYLFYLAVFMLAVVLDVVLRTGTFVALPLTGGPRDAGLLTSLVTLALFIPTLSMSVRRLHDVDKSGWWLLLAVIPVLGWLVLLSFFLQDGAPGVNRFGAAPGVRNASGARGAVAS